MSDQSGLSLQETIDAIAAEEAAVETDAAVEEEDKRKKRRILFWLLLGLIAIVLAVLGWYLLNRKPLTAAIPGLNENRVPAYQYSLYNLDKPLGVAVNADGSRIYVTESGTSLDVKILDADGNAVGKGELPKGIMHQPMYLAVRPDNGEVWVTDRNTHKIYILDSEGKYVRTFEPKGDLGKPEFSPLGIAFGPDDTLYVTDARGADAKQHRVLVFKADGSLVRSMGKPGELNYPNCVVVDGNGNAAVTDSNNGRMIIFDTEGAIAATIARGIGDGDLGLPRGIAYDGQGHLVVVDTTDHQIRVYGVKDDPTVAPAYVGSFGTEGRGDGQFEYPNGLASDERARIYVTDRENSRLQVWGY